MFTGEAWFEELPEGEKDLVVQAFELMKSVDGTSYHDYSFVVFPMAKAYEGYLKRWFYERNLIDESTYFGDRFRIGKALNPSMPLKHRGKWWLYARLVDKCGGKKLPDEIWIAWRECRNRLFHFFPKHKNFVTLGQAKLKIEQVKLVMTQLYEVKI
jgi:hypothetical protein